jgi:hypothetical protein
MKKTLIITATLALLAAVAVGQTVVDECLECLPHVIEKNWPAAISCAVTVAVGAIVRYFEKRRLLKSRES